jgi:2-C-methyl-D-erythritol 4-phosphate cytidylyltransferase
MTSVPDLPPAEGARCFALVPCAGVGERAGQALPKQYAMLQGRAMVAHTLQALAAVPRLHATLVVLAPADAWFEGCVPGFQGERAWLARCGGMTRAATVAAGLSELLRRGARSQDWVLVHDAARCLLQPAWVDRLIDACQGDAVGGLLALPLSDTLKQSQEGRVERTLDRSGKWAAQTPQMFRLGRLQQALTLAGDAVTDESSALEALGDRPLLVPGELENFKLTWPQDLMLAERLLALRTMEGKR